jgi:hypothetical protein
MVDTSELDDRGKDLRQHLEKAGRKDWGTEVPHVFREDAVEGFPFRGTESRRHPLLLRPTDLAPNLGSETLVPELLGFVGETQNDRNFSVVPHEWRIRRFAAVAEFKKLHAAFPTQRHRFPLQRRSRPVRTDGTSIVQEWHGEEILAEQHAPHMDEGEDPSPFTL